MNDTVTIPKSVWLQMQTDLKFIKDVLQPLVRSYRQPAWVSEAEAMEITGCKERTLRELRKKGTLNFRCNENGRKIQYLRTDLEKYAGSFSTITNLKKAI